MTERSSVGNAKTLVPERERVSLQKSVEDTLTEATLERRYHDMAPIGEGGMGDVRLVRDLVIGRDVAVKWMRRAMERDAYARERFLREAKVQGQLEHPSIVPVYDLGLEPGGRPFFTMRRVRGRTLDECATGPSKLSRHALLTAMSRVCLAIDFAHTHGVVHRDLKPANLMIGDYGEVYVLDWGVAKLRGGELDDADVEHIKDPSRVSSGSHRTTVGAVLGTPGYMPPEQVRGLDVDERADVFALGACMFEMLAGQPLFPGTDAQSLLAATLLSADARFSVRVPDADIPVELEAICVRATRTDPAERFASAREMSEAIERFLEGDRDVERRKARARDHALAAEKLAAAALGDAGEAARARADAMREVGRALANDPENADARRLMVRLLTEAPRAVPAEVRTQIEVEREGAIESARKLTAIAFSSALSPSLLVLWMGVRSWFWFWLGIAAAALGGLAALVPNRYGLMRERRFIIVSLGAVGLLANSRLAGPFVVVPVMAMGIAAGLALFPRVTHVFSAILAGSACVLLPLVLEWTGVLPPMLEFSGDRLCAVAQSASFDRVPTLVYLILGTLLPIGATCLYLVRIRDRLAGAELRLRLQAWQLRQILPDVEK